MIVLIGGLEDGPSIWAISAVRQHPRRLAHLDLPTATLSDQ